MFPDDYRDNLKNYLRLTGQVNDEIRTSTNTDINGRFHTNWLNMIYVRLRIARDLLSNDGVILISIDDHEVHNLRSLCAEVFGEENFIASLTWEKGRKNDAKLFSIGHEYILVLAKSLGQLRELGTVWREEKPGAREIWEKYLELRKQHGDDDESVERDLQIWFSELPKTHPSKKWSRYKRIDANGPWRDRDISWPGGGGPRYDVPHPVTKMPCKVPERGWIYSSSEEMQRQINLGLVEFRADHSEPPFRKAHIRPVSSQTDGVSFSEKEEQENQDELAAQVRGTYFYKQSQVAVRHLRQLFGSKVFDNPKDHEELARLFEYCTGNDKDAVIMDFFAGSGSTAQAVLEMNAKGLGDRRFILVQLPEALDYENKDQKVATELCDKLRKPRNIAELTKERLRRATTKIKEDNPTFTGDLGFRVFKLDSSNIRAWDPDHDDLDQSLFDSMEHLKPDRTEADILYELLLKLGLDLCVPIETRSLAGKEVHAVGGGVLMTCLAQTIGRDDVETLAQAIVDWHQALAPAGDTTCVFRDSAFGDDVAKTNMAAILEQHGIVNVRSL